MQDLSAMSFIFWGQGKAAFFGGSKLAKQISKAEIGENKTVKTPLA